MEQGKCPKCGSDNLDYETVVDDGYIDNGVYYPTECLDCGYQGKECHNLHFTEYIKEEEEEGG